MNPNNPIDPSSVRPVGPGLRPGDVITPIQIDNVRGGPGDLQWIDENPINPFGNAPNPFVDPSLVAKPLDITGDQGQVFQNPFSGGQGTSGGIIRKKPSYDGSHKGPVPPSLKKLPGYTGPAVGSDYPPPTGVIKPDAVDYPQRGILDQSGVLPGRNPFGNPNYDGPGFAPEVSPFGPFTGGIVDPLDQVNGGIRRKAPSYDNSHKLLPGQVIGGDTLSPIIPPRKPPSYDNSHKLLPGQVIGGPGQIIGGDPFNPIIPPRKPPSYDNSHKLQPGQVIGGDPARKAPSYDNSHKLGLGGEIPPVIPGSGYVKPPSVPGLSLPGGPRPGDVIDPFSLEAQQQQFDVLVSARLGARSGISPPSLPVQKKLSAGKRNYLSSLGVFKKAKSYES